MKNKYAFAIFYGALLTFFTIYIALDTFVIERNYLKVLENETEDYDTGNKITTDYSYIDDNIVIKIDELRKYDTTIYVADIKLKNSLYLKTAFAKDSYGRNVTEKTSEIAENNKAILAINGDYYGVRQTGYVLKNGTIYRDISKSDQEDLAIYEDGSFEIITEEKTSLSKLLDSGVYNLLSFGPCLLKDNEISVSQGQEVGKAMSSNPRTAIGIIDELHYVFVVSDGRTNESDGLTLYELALVMKDLDVDIAYNLDGGGSSTMYFNGNIINNPTTNGKKISERSVSDIVYIGY